MNEKREVNEYLYYEFCFDLGHELSAVDDDWPFQLKELESIRTHYGEASLYEFVHKGETYVVVSGPITAAYPVAGMTPRDIEIQLAGAAWLEQKEPVDLDTSRLGDDAVPSQPDRKSAILALAAEAAKAPTILEGYFLRATGRYIALVEDTDTGAVFLVGTDLSPTEVGFPDAHPGRRLAIALGILLEQGLLG